MEHLTLKVVEEILEGKISKNPKRFEGANGIVFSVNENEMTEEVKDYFASRAIEFHELVRGIYYTETIMSTAEFETLDYVMHIKHIA